MLSVALQLEQTLIEADAWVEACPEVRASVSALRDMDNLLAEHRANPPRAIGRCEAFEWQLRLDMLSTMIRESQDELGKLRDALRETYLRTVWKASPAKA